VYNLHHDYFYDIFYPIAKALKKESRIKVFYSYPFDDKSLKKYLMEKCIKNRLISNLYSPFLPFDLFICAEITSPDFPTKPLKTKKIQIYHGTGVYNLAKKSQTLRRFDIHFAVGPQYLPIINKFYHGIKKKPKIYKIGYPKLDALLKSTQEIAVLKNYYSLNNEKLTVLYAPHWNKFSSIHKFGEELIENLAKRNLNLLVKPHNYLFTKYPEQNWYRKLKKLSSQYINVKFVEQPNTQELYPLADIMITDTGTTNGLEFSILKKPLLLYFRNDWFNKNHNAEVERAICDTAICFQDIQELTSIVQKILDNNPPQKFKLQQQRHKQAELVNKYLYNLGNATTKAMLVIKNELKL
jgi:CDP-glycerol glycerophosphotransferase (TagB/SpsB family)